MVGCAAASTMALQGGVVDNPTSALGGPTHPLRRVAVAASEDEPPLRTGAGDTEVTTVRRGSLGAMMLLVLVVLTLRAPASVAACVCADAAEGDVVFTGKVTGSPNGFVLSPELFMPQTGVYTFDVESVTRGDPLDGRVYSGFGNCNSLFEVGGTYLVHAEVVDPAETRAGNPTDVPLLTNMCMANELLEPPPPPHAIVAWARSLPGVLVLGGGLFVVIVGASYLWYSRRTPTDPLLTGSD